MLSRSFSKKKKEKRNRTKNDAKKILESKFLPHPRSNSSFRLVISCSRVLSRGLSRIYSTFFFLQRTKHGRKRKRRRGEESIGRWRIPISGVNGPRTPVGTRERASRAFTVPRRIFRPDYL